jgi:hypothetical protein
LAAEVVVLLVARAVLASLCSVFTIKREIMPRYAIIEHNKVVNVAMADGPMDSNWIQSDAAMVGWTESNGVLSAPVVPTPPVVVDPCEFLLDIAPFTDRLEPHKYQIDTHTDPFIQYFNRDLSRRKYVDLKDPKVAAALNYMAGHATPGIGTIATPIFNDAFVANVINTPALLKENFALRKAYF